MTETNNLSIKYMIASVFKGEAEKLNRELSTEVSKNFGVSDVGNRIPPHITLKAPFYTSKISELEENLQNFANENKGVKLKFKNFGYFSNRTIFLDISPSQEGLSLTDKLTISLKKLSWMYFNEQDVNKKLHATVATFDIQSKFQEIWEFLAKKTVELEFDLDNVSILKKEGGKWVVHKEFALK